MRRTITAVMLLFIGLFITSNAIAQDKLSRIITQELNRNFEVMKNLDVPVYYISVRVEARKTDAIESSFGAISNESENSSNWNRTMTINMRVGSPKFDNMHYSGNLSNIIVVNLPANDVEEEIKIKLWRGLQQAYSKAKDDLESNLSEKNTRPEEEDKSPDFILGNKEIYFEKELDYKDIVFDKEKMRTELKALSKILADNRDILKNYVAASTELTRKYFIDTEGTMIVQNEPAVRMYATGVVMAEDGMLMEDDKTFFARSAAKFPSFEEIAKEIKDMSNTLSGLKKSPKIDSYTGPILLSSDVTGVFFHEFFGHRVEGARMKSGRDSQTLKKKIGELVLPERISVKCDPTISTYRNLTLSGDYKYDDEGVKGQSVELVKNGVLKKFLINRIPIDGFSESNGHGRGNIDTGTESRQSNLIVESSNPVSPEELNKLFINELKKRNQEYGYRIDKVSGGLTMNSDASANAFYLKPLVVHRVYVDGRPDELVRGINIVGTPLVAFMQILAESNTPTVFNGVCGASSGWVPVSAVAPAMLIKELEFQKIGDSKKMDKFILERP